MPESFDFFSAFLGVDIGKVEMITELFATVEACYLRTLISKGIDEDLARVCTRDSKVAILDVLDKMYQSGAHRGSPAPES